jgi:hypothetical protein
MSRIRNFLVSFDALIIPLLLVFLILVSGPVEDGDFYWHSATGDWIIEHGKLPQQDPFSHTTARFVTAKEEQEKVVFFLQQYWLGQVVLNGVWRLGDEASVVAFRALAYTLLVAWFFFFVRQRAGSSWIALLATLAFADLLLEYPGERPTLFTFLFFFAALNILDRPVRREKDGRLSGSLYFLPFLMVLWANMHGGYVLGVALIVAYLVGGLWADWRRRRPVDWRLAGILGASMLATGLNPNGYMALRVAFNFFSPGEASRNYEFLGPLQAAQLYGDLYPAYWLILISGSAILIWRFFQVRPAHALAFSGIALLSFMGLRNMIFLPMVWALLPGALPRVPRFDRAFSAAAVGVMLFWAAQEDYHQVLRFEAHPDFPEQATRFMKAVQPPGPVYNKYEWGGYLIQYLPEYPVFIDGRGLSGAVSRMDDEILWGENWSQILDDFGIGTLLISGVSDHSGRIFPLARNLLSSRSWRLLYYDDAAMVLVRGENWSGPVPPGGNAEGKEGIPRHILARVEALEYRIPESADLWVSKAEALLLLGRSNEARRAAEIALQIDPNHVGANRVLSLPHLN